MKITHLLGVLLLAASSGCSHYHSLTVTSEPSDQLIEIQGYGGVFSDGPVDHEGKLQAVACRTPYEFTFPGQIDRVIVTVGDQTKVVSFSHGVVLNEVVCEPILGLPLWSTKKLDQPINKTMHFDIAPVGSR